MKHASLLLILMAFASRTATAQVTYTKIARTGEFAPGTFNQNCPPPQTAIFAAFRPPVITRINGDDRVAFVATTSGCDSALKGTGLWAQVSSNSLSRVARQLDQFVFGQSTCTLSVFDTGGSYFTTDGSLAFHTTLAGAGCPAEVAFVRTALGVVPTMAFGDAVLNTTLTGLPQPFGLAPGGALGAGASLASGLIPRAVLHAEYPNYTVLANTTMAAPTPPGGLIDVISLPSTNNQHVGPAFNQVGQAALLCTLTTPAGAACLRAQLNPPGLSKIASTSDQEPQAPNLFYSGFSSVEINDYGTVAFGASVGSGPQATGIWVGNPGSTRQVARSGNASPDASGALNGPNFASFGPPALNNNGRVAFQATLSGGDTGIWYEDNNTGALRLLARKGQSAPYLGATPQTFKSFPLDIVYNDFGSVAFLATLNSAWTFGDVHALYATGQLQSQETADPVLYVIAQEDQIVPSISPSYTCQAIRVRALSICRGSSMLSNSGAITFSAGRVPADDIVIVARFPQ